MLEVKKQVVDFVRQHPGYFAWLTFRRFAYTWTGFWSLRPDYTANEPFQIPNTVVCTAITVLMLLGWRKARRTAQGSMTPILLMLVLMPLTYYISHPSIDYRHPIDPEILMLAVYAFVGAKRLPSGDSEQFEVAGAS
jgi:hypothetical protein